MQKTGTFSVWQTAKQQLCAKKDIPKSIAIDSTGGANAPSGDEAEWHARRGPPSKKYCGIF